MNSKSKDEYYGKNQDFSSKNGRKYHNSCYSAPHIGGFTGGKVNTFLDEMTEDTGNAHRKLSILAAINAEFMRWTVHLESSKYLSGKDRVWAKDSLDELLDIGLIVRDTKVIDKVAFTEIWYALNQLVGRNLRKPEPLRTKFKEKYPSMGDGNFGSNPGF